MTNSTISAAVIPTHDTAEENLGFDDISDFVTSASREQDSAALSRGLTTSQVDYVKFPGFLSRHQQDLEGHSTSRTPLNSAAKWFKQRWPIRSRSVDSLDRYPDPDTHRDWPPTPPSAPQSKGPRMYHPPTREQQSEARRQRAAVRSRNRDGVPVQREEDNNPREETQSHVDDHNPPQENLTKPQDNWSPRQNLDELRRLPTPLMPLVSQPDPRLPPATHHSIGNSTMTTHSVTQTRQSMDTHTPTARPDIQSDPARGLEALFGDTPQPTPQNKPTLPSRPEVDGPSQPQKAPTAREAQSSHPIQDETAPIVQSPATRGSYTIPNHTLVDNLSRVGEDLLQQTTSRDRPGQLLGFNYNQGDGWDHSHLDLVGNGIIQGPTLGSTVRQSDEVPPHTSSRRLELQDSHHNPCPSYTMDQ